MILRSRVNIQKLPSMIDNKPINNRSSQSSLVDHVKSLYTNNKYHPITKQKSFFPHISFHHYKYIILFLNKSINYILLFSFCVFVLLIYILLFESPILCDSPKVWPADSNSADVNMQYTFYLDKITALLNIELFFNLMTQINYYIDCSLATFNKCYPAIHDAIGLAFLCIKLIYNNLTIASAFNCVSLVSAKGFILSYPITSVFLLAIFSELFNATLKTHVAVDVKQPTDDNPPSTLDVRGVIASKRWYDKKHHMVFDTSRLDDSKLRLVWPDMSFSQTRHTLWGDYVSMYKETTGLRAESQSVSYRFYDASASPIRRTGFWVRVPFILPNNLTITSGGLPVRFKSRYNGLYMFVVADDIHTMREFNLARTHNRVFPMVTRPLPNSRPNTINSILN